jgi:glycosyltransferase involved in cell wall biosynthesis
VRRENHKCFSPAGLNKSKGITSMIKKSGYEVTVLSPSFVNNKTGKVYRSFYEKYNEYDLYHSLIWDIPYINMLTSILWISCTLVKQRHSYDKILFYNYTPETAIPAFFAKIILRKEIYLEYEDGYFALDIFKPLKWLIAINEKIGNNLISGAILVTENLRQRVKTKNIQVIPGIIDQKLYNHFSKLSQKRDAKKVIMYSGGLDEIRGIDILLDVAEEIINEIEGDYEFWVTGKGPLEQMVHYYAKRFPDKIHYYGFVSKNKLLGLYEYADAFVSLQKPEHKFSAFSSPSKVYEFISTGKFCIGLIDLKINSDNYINMKDLESLKSTLVNIINGSYNKPSIALPHNPQIHIFQ